ncbi:MAG: hypothetical protein K9W44_02395 [Candidatus Lokiarchaeota archaeon]|nr:hypothetical protein [Candidatus Harpocratesius repetitus]
MKRDRYPTNSPNTPITNGFLISISEYYSLLRSSELPRLYDEFSSILCVYAIYPRLSRITCYPGNFSAVYKIYLEFQEDGLLDYQVHSQQISSYNVIHTTGLSKHNSHYSVEYYVEGSEEQEKWDKFKDIIDLINLSRTTLRCSGEFIRFQDHS